MSSTLYNITEDVELFMQLMEEEPDNEVIRDTLEGLNGELEIKAESYCKVIKEFEGKAAMLDAELTRLTTRKSTYVKNVDRLKRALLNAMQTTNNAKIKGELFTLSLRNNAPSLDEVPEKLPRKYMIKQNPTVDRKLLLSDMKLGVKIKGVTLKQTQSLMIK